MKIKSIFLGTALSVIMLFSFSSFAAAEEYGNEWVYDEPQVISVKTEDYIKNLNETVFSEYRNKPQLAIVMIHDLPYDMQQYKLDLFNDYGVGTADENCGMLFLFAINNREYGLEIGDGFKNGSILRKELESDFITESMKDSLRAGDYDSVIFQVVQHLESIMANEEAGVYAQLEAEKLAVQAVAVQKIVALSAGLQSVAKGLVVALCILCPAAALLVLAFHLITTHLWKKKVYSLLDSHYKYVSMAQITKEEFISYLKDKQVKRSSKDTEAKILDLLYSVYLDKQLKQLEQSVSNHSYLNKYKNTLRRTNNFQAFKDCRLTSLSTIVYRVDEEEKQKSLTIQKNQELIEQFFAANKHRIVHNETQVSIYKTLCNQAYTDKQITQDVLETAFVRALHNANFQWEVDRFLLENKDQARGQFFDRSSFLRELSSSANYHNYTYSSSYDRSWMYPLLVMHMGSRRKAHEDELELRRQEQERRREEEARRKEEEEMHSNNSSFGSGFGGGFSSGGGFKGGW